jgi:hypothetical protein
MYSGLPVPLDIAGVITLITVNTIFPSRGGSRKRRGAAAVELAVTAPLLFMMVFGMIETGRAMMVQHLLTNAARDGARSATLDGATATSVEDQVETYLAGSSVAGATATVSPNPLSLAQIGDAISVTASIPFNSVNWVGSGFFFGDVNLSATVTMRCENSSAPAE